MSETGNQNEIREHFCAQDWRLWRCNTGALTDETGRLVRFGLANDSKQMNEQIKPGDLIGWRPVLVTPDMVGDVFAQFVSIEAKANGWKFPGVTDVKRNGRLTGYGHCLAQRRWAEMVRRDGGVAGFMIDPVRGFEPC